MTDYAIVLADDVDDLYEGTDVPGEFRRLTDALGAEQLAATLIRVPPHSDFEQGTGHFHDEVEELYLVTRGTLTMRFGDDDQTVRAGSAVRVAPSTARSHRNEGDEPVEMWAISRADAWRRHQDRRLLGGLAGRRAAAAERTSTAAGQGDWGAVRSVTLTASDRQSDHATCAGVDPAPSMPGLTFVPCLTA